MEVAVAVELLFLVLEGLVVQAVEALVLVLVLVLLVRLIPEAEAEAHLMVILAGQAGLES
jgi:hypothetical protein